MKKVKPNNKTRTKSKATVEAKPGNKPAEKNPWKIAVLEMFALINDTGIDEDLYEELTDVICNTCNTTVAAFSTMVDEHEETKKEAKRFKRVLAITTLQSAWKSLTGEQQELLMDMDVHNFKEQITE